MTFVHKLLEAFPHTLLRTASETSMILKEKKRRWSGVSHPQMWQLVS